MRLFLLSCLCCLGLMAFAEEKPVEEIGWGVVTATPAKTYTKAGKPADAIPCGTLFRLLKEITMEKAPAYFIAVANAERRVVAASDCYVVKGECLMDEMAFAEQLTQGGDLAKLTAQMKAQKALERYYSALGVREQFLQRARDKHLQKSPAKNLAKFRAELATIPERDRVLEAKQKKAKNNSERLNLRDERKTLRRRAQWLMLEIEEAKQVAESWEKEHPFDAMEAKSSGVYKTLNRAVKSAEAQLREVLPDHLP